MLWAAETVNQIGHDSQLIIYFTFMAYDAVCTISEVLFGDFILLEPNKIIGIEKIFMNNLS